MYIELYFSVSRGLGGLDTTSNLNQSIVSLFFFFFFL